MSGPAKNTATQNRGLTIRWLVRADLADVLAIEATCFRSPWAAEDFTRLLRRRDVIGLVAEEGAALLGYAIYTLRQAQFELLNLAVGLPWQRSGVGQAIVEKIKGKLGGSRQRRSIVAHVAAANLPAQLFLRACGFRATDEIADWFLGGEAALRFVYHAPKPKPKPRAAE